MQSFCWYELVFGINKVKVELFYATIKNVK